MNEVDPILEKKYVSFLDALYTLITKVKKSELGLTRIKKLLEISGNPQNDFKIFHIAGTNGKGSVCAFLSSMFKEANIPCGLFTSPHLSTIRERIQINQNIISKSDFCLVSKVVLSAVERLEDKPSFFEIMMAMALLYFKFKKVKVVILEVGLGGRLDATNVVQPIACGITAIQKDHTKILGKTLRKIAIEKAHIIKKNTISVTIKQKKSAQEEIFKRAEKVGSQLFQVGKDIKIGQKDSQLEIYDGKKIILPKVTPGIVGGHQLQNAALAVSLIEKTGFIADLKIRKKGIEKSFWPGRYEYIQKKPPFIIDAAHNPDSIKQLFSNLEKDQLLKGKPAVFILGISSGKDITKIAQIWTKKAPFTLKLLITQVNNKKALNPKEIKNIFCKQNIANIEAVDNPNLALKKSFFLANENNGYIVAAGSIYLIGHIRSSVLKIEQDPLLLMDN